MAYTAWSVVFGEQPTAAKWNQLGENDAGFRDGTNIANDAIVNSHMADDSVTGDNLNLDNVDTVLAANFATSSTTFVDPIVKVTLPAIGVWLIMADVRALGGSAGQFGIAELYNFTTAAQIANSERLAPYAAAASERQYAPITRRVVTTTTNNSVGLRYKSGGAYSVTLESDPNGRTTLLAIRIG